MKGVSNTNIIAYIHVVVIIKHIFKRIQMVLAI